MTPELVPTVAVDGPEATAAFWARTAMRLLTENTRLRVHLGDLRLAAHSVKAAKSDLERQIAASVLVELAMRGGDE